MTEPRKIGGGFVKTQIDIDGNKWNYREIGSREGTALSTATEKSKLYGKRVELISKKIENDTVTEEELDNQETYIEKFNQAQEEVYNILFACLNDGTKDNKSVKEWFYKTPTWKVQQLSEDIIGIQNGQNEKAKEDSQSS